MATELQKYRNPGTIQPNVTILTGTLTIGAAGAITAQTDTRNSGVTFTRNSAGRYDGVLHRAYRRVMGGMADFIYPTAGTAKSLTTGSDAYLQGVSANNVSGAAGISTFSVCTPRPDTGALADPASGSIVSWTLIVSDSQ